ncbi:hypothetical protein HOD83_00650 [Candidatus Woesearchaeota archaeon]|jgi:hypothetical protein|nr:hypothetical protein [Candidatus Woesearchaeota archaeon]MBT4248085.1 hypothetical protein [Candidatus Woesearchaeota archaeon]
MKNPIENKKLREFYQVNVYKIFITLLFFYAAYSIAVTSTISMYCLDHGIEWWKCSFDVLNPSLKLQIVVGMIVTLFVIYNIACVFYKIRRWFWRIVK